MALIPIYTSKGDAEAFLDYPHLFNRNGDWIGWVTPKRDVYSVLGHYVGYLTNDPRISKKTRHVHAQTSTSTTCPAEKSLSACDSSPCPNDERVDP